MTSKDKFRYYEKVEQNINIVYVPFGDNLLKTFKSIHKYKVNILSDNINLLFTHAGLNLAVASSGKKIEGNITEKMLRGWDYVGLGDFHRAQDMGNNIYYSGKIRKFLLSN